ncbi:SigE family RNA polymerase sigma factor [Jatrophihabitans cynanchi]|uniref:SigE family RNA polymerase sigma factor n=1 Tax=Jatrophihabitans cynanchi TaxID=2944128 RepID=UPI0038B23F32
MGLDFETYVAQSRTGLLRLAIVVTDDRELAQDVVQEVLMKAGQRWAKIGRLDHPHAYVRRMLSNEIISWHRKWGRVESRPALELDRAIPDPAGAVDRREALLREVARLPVQQRSAIALRYFEDLSDEQIGVVLGCRPATVRAHLHRALKTLRVESTLEALNPIR